ncbi:MAG: hypothetical protein QOF28_28 [Actinomycetota bacterium]|nr:hypothetical protein [Actinomycetota bacterium]
MPILDSNHDFAHPVEGDQAWSESYYFNAYDPVSDTGFFTRLAIRPNEKTMDAGMSVWLPGNELAHAASVREQTTMVDTGLSVGGVTYERLEPMQRWHLTADCDVAVRDLVGESVRDGHVLVDATFDALMPAIGADGQGREGEGASAKTRQSVGKGHLEQAGRWSGSITVDGTKFELGEARGNRDKSWGPRRWGGTGSRMWRWFSINIGDDIHFGGIRIGTDSGDLHRGWVWRDGEYSSIREWDVRTELEDDGVTHRVSHVRATDKRDRVHELRADVIRVAPHRMQQGDSGSLLNEGLARWTYEGRTGWGISEYLHTLDGRGQPTIPIA